MRIWFGAPRRRTGPDSRRRRLRGRRRVHGHSRRHGRQRARDRAAVARRDWRRGHARARGRAVRSHVYEGPQPRRVEGRRRQGGQGQQGAERAGAGRRARRPPERRHRRHAAVSGADAPTTASPSRRHPGTIDELAALPGVAAVHVIPLVELDNHSSVPLIGALQAWGAYGKTGTGMRIAVIDTGVDYVHRDFGGSGSSAPTTSSRAAPPRIRRRRRPTTRRGFSIPGIYPSAKVVGGWDFAGDNYTRLRAEARSRSRIRTRWTATATARTCPARPPARASTPTAPAYAGPYNGCARTPLR